MKTQSKEKLALFVARELKSTIRLASDDLEYILQPLTGEMRSAPNIVAKADLWVAVQSAAQRGLWLAVSDKAYLDFGLDLPEYAKAAGHPARRLVDAEAVRFANRLAKAA